MDKQALKKVLIVTNIPNPYRIPLFNVLNRELMESGTELRVCFGAQSSANRKFRLDMGECQFAYEYLNSASIKLPGKGKALLTYSGVLKVVDREKPDIVIVAGFSIATFKLWFRAMFRDLKYIIWCGSLRTKSRKDSWSRILFRKMLARRASGFIAYSSSTREYFMQLGIDKSKIKIAINTTDTHFFAEQTRRIRSGLKESDKKILLAIGYLRRLKRFDQLLRVVKVLSTRRGDFVLLIVGDGPYRTQLDEMVEDFAIGEFVQFEGFKQKTELPSYLAGADCFLFPSDYDIWGMVLNEAMAAGVPCIASIHAGATHDLIKEGETGFAVDFEETERAADRINWILDHPADARRIGDKAARFIADHAGLQNSARGFIDAIRGS
jgi:glycosyltransferase involved in cell wall biosynthesis